MLGEHHDIDHEFPEYHEKISRLSDRDPEFAALMKEHDRLDDEIRELELHDQPVSDVYIEDQKKKRALLKDKIYGILRHTD
jgi:uncharacterized protein YdcH (DUF465 family)